MENVAETSYKISKHCKERYVERIMNKDTNYDINRFIVENEEKIKTDINKMIIYGEKIFSGKQSQKDGKGNVLDVYLNGTWIVLVDNKENVVVTVYKIDLGCGDEFNREYIGKMMENLNHCKEKLMSVQLEVNTESEMYRELIESAQTQINEYKAMVKNLEELCKGYQAIIDNNRVKVSQATREVADVINTLTNKREF